MLYKKKVQKSYFTKTEAIEQTPPYLCLSLLQVEYSLMRSYPTFAPRPQIWSIYLSEGCALDGDEVIYLIGEELGRGNRCIFQ